MVHRKHVAWWASIALVIAAVASVIGVLIGPKAGVDVGFVLLSLSVGGALALVGGMLVSARRGSLLGPALMISGGGLVAGLGLRTYAYLGHAAAGLPLDEAAGWVGLSLDPLFFPLVLILILILFPTGLARQWWERVVMTVALAGVLAQILVLALRRGPWRTSRSATPSHGRLPV